MASSVPYITVESICTIHIVATVNGLPQVSVDLDFIFGKKMHGVGPEMLWVRLMLLHTLECYYGMINSYEQEIMELVMSHIGTESV